MFIFIAAFINDAPGECLAMLGLLTGTLTGAAFGLDISGGGCGYNGYLIGCALRFFQPGYHGSDWNASLVRKHV